MGINLRAYKLLPHWELSFVNQWSSPSSSSSPGSWLTDGRWSRHISGYGLFHIKKISAKGVSGFKITSNLREKLNHMPERRRKYR
jgi:hypothetical protein